MEWLKRLGAAIDYIEENLDKEISYDEAAHMDFMSSLWEQNPKQNQRRHSFEKLSSLLPEM